MGSMSSSIDSRRMASAVSPFISKLYMASCIREFIFSANALALQMQNTARKAINAFLVAMRVRVCCRVNIRYTFYASNL